MTEMTVLSLTEARKSVYKGAGLIKMVSWKKMLPFTHTQTHVLKTVYKFSFK